MPKLPKLCIRLLLIASLLLTGVVTAQETTDDIADDDISDELRQQITTIENTTSSIRELDALDDVTRLFPTRDDLSDYLRTTLASEFTDDLVAQSQAFYAAFEFIPADLDLRETILTLYEDQVAGFYDPETEEMNVILMSGNRPGNFLPLLDQIIYSHEYVHALQDQHFDLQALLDGVDPQENGDAFIGRQALAEGDATAVMNTYTQIAAQANPIGALMSIGIQGAQSGTLTMPAELPEILGTELTWSYLQGEQFVNALRENGGWEAVNAAYENPPASSEHIYHPQRYIDNDMPITVDLAVDDIDGWSAATDGVFGEFYLRQYLAQHLDSGIVSQAATGWGGDAYQVYDDGDDGFAWEMLVEWDSDTDATEFSDAIERLAEAYPLEEAINISGTAGCWANDAGTTLCLNNESNTTTRVTFAPAPDVAQALLGATD